MQNNHQTEQETLNANELPRVTLEAVTGGWSQTRDIAKQHAAQGAAAGEAVYKAAQNPVVRFVAPIILKGVWNWMKAAA